MGILRGRFEALEPPLPGSISPAFQPEPLDGTDLTQDNGFPEKIGPGDRPNTRTSEQGELRMNLDTARKIVIAAIALLIFREFASFLAAVAGTVPAMIGAVLVLSAQLFFSRLVGKGLRHYAYILIPTLVFTAVPVALKVRRFLGIGGRSSLGLLWDITPMMVGFVLPVLLLLIAWWILGKQDPGVSEVRPEKPVNTASPQS